MIITAQEVIDYLCEYCDELQCPYREIEVCPDDCPVAIACKALNELNGDTYAFTIRETQEEEEM